MDAETIIGGGIAVVGIINTITGVIAYKSMSKVSSLETKIGFLETRIGELAERTSANEACIGIILNHFNIKKK